MRCDEVMTTTSPHGSSAARATAANGRPWWRSAVVYQIYPRSFADSNGDGIGDLTGITSKVDYLAELGVDVVWLSPIYPSPQDDNGYDISNYQEIDPVFGTLADFDELLAALHDRGIKLVMDLVVNHTSDEHPWFIESRSSPDNPKRNWYWWRGPREGMHSGDLGAEPTNWQSFFSGSAWEFDEDSREYYLHIFSRRQPDLNWENSEVRQAVYAMMRWWLDRGIDGFRMDVINMISKDPTLPDGLVRSGLWGDGTPFFVGGPRLHEYLQEMHREVLADRDGQFLTVGEMPFVTVEQARLFTDPARAELDMVFQFEHVWLDRGASKWDVQPLRLRDLKATLGRWQAGLAEVGWNSLYWNNHDQPRSVSRFGDDHNYRVLSAKLLATVLHLHRGTPYVYQGDEIGMTNAPFASIDDFDDIESRNHYTAAVAAGEDPDTVLEAMRHMSRDNARTPMQWDDSPNAGFTTGTPWLPVNPNYRQINVAEAVDDPNSIFHYFRRVIALRHTDPVVAYGDFTMLIPDDELVYAYTRGLDGVLLLVVANFSDTTVPADVPERGAWAASQLVLANYPVDAGADLELRPWECRVYRRMGAAPAG